MNSMSQPTTGKSNCENDDCTPLDNLRTFITNNYEEIVSQSEEQIELEVERYLNIEKSNLAFENSRKISSVASNLLAIIKVPKNCQTCQDSLFSKEITERDFMSLLDVNLNDQSAQTYASDSVLLLIENAYNYLCNFLKENGHKYPLEEIFIQFFKQSCSAYRSFCKDHPCEWLIVSECFCTIIQKFVKQGKATEETAGSKIPKVAELFQVPKFDSEFSVGHKKKMKKFIESKSKWLIDYSKNLSIEIFWSFLFLKKKTEKIILLDRYIFLAFNYHKINFFIFPHVKV